MKWSGLELQVSDYDCCGVGVKIIRRHYFVSFVLLVIPFKIRVQYCKRYRTSSLASSNLAQINVNNKYLILFCQKRLGTKTFLSMTRSDMLDAIDLNNSGSAHVAAGRYRDALIDFKHAAELMYSSTTTAVRQDASLYCEDGEDDGYSFSDDDDHEIMPTSKNRRKSHRMGDEHNSHDNDDDEEDDDEDTKVRNDRRKRAKRTASASPEFSQPNLPILPPRRPQEPCFLRTTPFQIAASPEPTYTEVSTVILFNMALTYQLSFMQNCSLPKSIENAAGLYGMAGSIAMKHLDQSSFTRLLMASLNNLGFLYFEIGNYQLAKEYFDEMSRCIVNLNPRAITPEVLQEKDELLLNTMVLKEPHGAKAA